MTVYPTKIDWWMRPLLFVPLLGCAASIYAGNVRDDQRALFVAYACLITYGLLMVGLAFLADCARASGKHHVVDGTLVRA